MTAILNPGIQARISLKAPTAVGSVTVSTTGNRSTITLSLDPAGVYLVRAWLADDTAGTPSARTPNVSGIKEWDVLTDAAGQRVFEVEESGAQSWYFCWAVLAYLNVNTTALEFT